MFHQFLHAIYIKMLLLEKKNKYVHITINCFSNRNRKVKLLEILVTKASVFTGWRNIRKNRKIRRMSLRDAKFMRI